MSRPKCYDPQEGYMYQLIYRYNTREWEHLDYATTMSGKEYLMGEYALAYRGTGGEISCILLPEKYWDKAAEKADRIERRKKWQERRRLRKQLELQQSSTFVNEKGELQHG